ncbi:energy-coupling factor transporter transmembrane component T [uncultured Desulfosarcina sp.]|uniref:energy-coupling factor transporter transmembrane component T family protein n=1 Tax=uncultured Desulfosarcina sp. TaxID=218289 RepID=UPI0029C7CA85|nr:energy-coupling factor transporter transmembrane component T [uncultured Desulfosarcina sp.]
MGEIAAIGFTPGRSLLHRLDPRTKQILLMGLGAISPWADFFFLSILSTALLYCFAIARVPFGRLVREIRYFLFFLAILFCLRTISFHSWMPVFAVDQAAEALKICWRLLLVVLMGLLVMATTRTAHIRAALVWFLKPVPLIDEKMAATMVGLVVRFLPQILFQAAEISDAQRARCADRCKNPLIRLKRFGIPLFRRVFSCADELVAAMQVRCYSENRTLPELCFTSTDLLAMVAAGLISLTALIP